MQVFSHQKQKFVNEIKKYEHKNVQLLAMLLYILFKSNAPSKTCKKWRYQYNMNYE